MKTRPIHDHFTSIKIPDSLRRHLKLIGAKEDKHIYQVLADLIVNYIESHKPSDT